MKKIRSLIAFFRFKPFVEKKHNLQFLKTLSVKVHVYKMALKRLLFVANEFVIRKTEDSERKHFEHEN